MTRIAALTLALIATVVQATDVENCLSQAKNSSDTARCYALELERVDKDLNAAYRDALRKIAALEQLNPEQRKGVRDLLVSAQRSWILFRDSDCGAVSAAFGSGTGHAIGELECRIQLTRHRTEELSRWERW